MEAKDICKAIMSYESTITTLREMDEGRVKQIKRLEEKCVEYKQEIKVLTETIATIVAERNELMEKLIDSQG